MTFGSLARAAEAVAAPAADRIEAVTGSRLLALVETGDEDRGDGKGGGLDADPSLLR